MADRELDLRGFACPLPVLKARKALLGMTRGQRLRVVATDPKTPHDFTHFCAESGHVLVESTSTGDEFQFLIERT